MSRVPASDVARTLSYDNDSTPERRNSSFFYRPRDVPRLVIVKFADLRLEYLVILLADYLMMLKVGGPSQLILILYNPSCPI